MVLHDETVVGWSKNSSQSDNKIDEELDVTFKRRLISP